MSYSGSEVLFKTVSVCCSWLIKLVFHGQNSKRSLHKTWSYWQGTCCSGLSSCGLGGGGIFPPPPHFFILRKVISHPRSHSKTPQNAAFWFHFFICYFPGRHSPRPTILAMALTLNETDAIHECHETCHSVTFIVVVNSQQR